MIGDCVFDPPGNKVELDTLQRVARALVAVPSRSREKANCTFETLA
jgi:hypothetical protein